MFGQRRVAEEIPRCSFCSRTQDQVDALISNPSERSKRVFICDKCVTVCNSVLEEHHRAKAGTVQARLRAAVLEEHKNAQEAGNTVVARLKAFAARR
jgi:ATP-dependent Clp protease ATP-binding subunit ClpX